LKACTSVGFNGTACAAIGLHRLEWRRQVVRQRETLDQLRHAGAVFRHNRAHGGDVGRRGAARCRDAARAGRLDGRLHKLRRPPRFAKAGENRANRRRGVGELLRRRLRFHGIERRQGATAAADPPAVADHDAGGRRQADTEASSPTEVCMAEVHGHGVERQRSRHAIRQSQDVFDGKRPLGDAIGQAPDGRDSRALERRVIALEVSQMRVLFQCTFDSRRGSDAGGAVAERRHDRRRDFRLLELCRDAANEGAQRLLSIRFELELYRDPHRPSVYRFGTSGSGMFSSTCT
jgi:hypothetical protein